MDAPVLLREFVEQHERVVTKPLSSGCPEDSGTRSLFAVDVTPDVFKRHTSLRAPALVQAYCSVDVEIRCTVVDGRVFAASLPAPPEHKVDSKYALLAGGRYTPCILSAEETALVVNLVSELGLRFAAVDLGRTKHGPPVLFEVNTAGQYQGIEEQTGLPITDAVAVALLGEGI